MISTHVVRVLVGTFFRSSPIWTWYMKLNGAQVGGGVYINSLAISDTVDLPIDRNSTDLAPEAMKIGLQYPSVLSHPAGLAQ